MDERVPCPHCAELIMPAAKFCRFCRKTVQPRPPAPPAMSPPVNAKRLNIPALIALPLAILAWPICGVFFFLIFSQLLPSLLAGAIVAIAALACGITGICAAARKHGKTGGLILSIGAVVIAGLSLMSLTGSYVLGKATSKKLPASLSPVKQVLGTEKPTQQPMKCAQCGHEFEVSSLDLIKQQIGTGLQAMGGVEDIDQLLDNVEASGAQGYPCPNCQSKSAWPMLTCPQCQTRFSVRQPGSTGMAATCPNCGTVVPLLTEDFLRQTNLDDAIQPTP